MKNKEFRNSKLKHQLSEKKKKGIKFVIWRLNPQQVDFVESLGYEVIPHIFKIRKKRFIFKDVLKKGTILKKVNYSKKDFIFSTLKKDEKELLDEFDVHYSPYKHKIVLN